MANSFWNFVTQFVPNTLAKAEDVNTNFSGVDAGFTLVETQTLQAIKIIDTPGVVDINSSPAVRANKIISFDGAGGILASIYIGNYRGNHVGVAGTVYNVRDTTKDAAGALGLNNIYICNTTHTSTGDLLADTANWDILLDAAAAAASAAAALVSANNAAASFTSFDNRYLGAKASDPTLNNSGGALIDGAQYFNTTLNRMKVYDLGTTAWLLTTGAAVDVSIADAGGLLNGINTETAIQELAGASIPVFAGGTNVAVTLTYGLPASVSGDIFCFTSTANVLAGATLSIDGEVAKVILTNEGLSIGNEDIIANGTYFVKNNGGVNYYLLNPSRTKNKVNARDSINIGAETDFTTAASLNQARFGKSTLLYSSKASILTLLAMNYYTDNGGNDNIITTGPAAFIRQNSFTLQFGAAPTGNAGTTPVFKTPISINLETGVVGVNEPASFKSVYEQPPVTIGTGTAYTATVGITAYVTGTVYKVRIHTANTGSATMTLDGLLAKTVKLITGSTLTLGDMAGNLIAELLDDGTDLILMNPSEYISTWIPTLGNSGSLVAGPTYSLQDGTVRKLRGKATLYFAMILTSKVGLAGNVTVNDFPILSRAANPVLGGAIHQASNLSITAGQSLSIAPTGGPFTVTFLNKWSTATGTALVTDADLTNTTQIVGTIDYFV